MASRLALILALVACNGASLPPIKVVPVKVPDALVCKLNVLLALPRDPEAIDYNAVKALIDGVNGCDAIERDPFGI